MTERPNIEIAVLTSSQEDVELVNRTLRDAGQTAHCHWVESSRRLDETLDGVEIELLIVNEERYADGIAKIVKQKNVFYPEVPVLALRAVVDEDSILDAMHAGACDLVSIDNMQRLLVVVDRELRAYRVERALNSTLTSATAYRRQLDEYMANAASAIAFVQEGIIVEANQSWLKLYSAKQKSDIVGQPLMDFFLAESQAAVKGAVVATMKGKWQSGHKLSAKSDIAGNDGVELELDFRLTDADGGPFVQVRIAPPKLAIEEPTKLAHDALRRDPTTLFLHRAQFLDRLKKRLKKKPKSGLQALAVIKPDDFSQVRADVGILDTEDVLGQFAEEIRKRMHPRDVAGRFEGTVIMALLERGNDRDAEVWGQQLVDHVKKHTFRVGDQELKLTCSVGVIVVSGVYSDLEEMVSAAMEAHESAREKGGNCAHLQESREESTRIRKYDKIWVKHIKSALMDNRFRLAQLPIAGLRGDAEKMYDLLVRMIDQQGNAILPSEFLPAAERNNLMKTIDRWMITASIKFCVSHKAEKAFVRISQHSIQDESLIEWMESEFERTGLEPGHLCIQFPEEEAAKYIKDTRQAVAGFKKLGVEFALEHYGVEQNRMQILDMLKPNYIKIDGELMHSLSKDTDMQQAVRKVCEAAQQRQIETIAERVENANEMAVLFQLGVHYMQGHYVHEPEVVLEETLPTAKPTTLEAIGNS
ncbi:MAG: EAL domain-containing protein [Woeseiaceae bacterium]|nr:EAL domain-containing protein [Woeseiaceae bacterium]